MLRLLNENDKNEIMESISKLDSQVAGGQIVIEKSGEVITAHDSAEAELVGLSVFGKSTQDGTPTPTAPIEIVSVEEPTILVYGKNIIKHDGNTQTINGITFTVNNDGSITANGTSTENAVFILSGSKTKVPAGTYVLSGCPKGGGHTTYAMACTEIGIDYGDGIVKTFEEETTLETFYPVIYKGATVNNITFYPMLEAISDKSDKYEPYKEPQSLSVPYTLRGIPVTSGGNYTDENGQEWICDEVDFERGLLVQRIANKVFDGSSDEIWYDELTLDTTVMFRIQISDSVNVGNVVGKDFICTHFEAKNMYNSDTTGVQHTMQQFYFRLPKTALSTADMNGFKALLSNSPMTVSYAIKTPVETALSEEELEAYKMLHTNKPNTTIFNDIGTGMAVEYVADHKLYVDNKFAELQALITS